MWESFPDCPLPDPARFCKGNWRVYVGNKKKACAYVGVDSLSYELPENTAQEELLSLIGDLNANSRVRSFITSPAIISPATEGTKATLPGLPSS